MAPTNMHNNSETNKNNEAMTLEEFLIKIGAIERSDSSSSQQEIMPKNVVDHNGPIMNTTTNVQTTHQEDQMGYNFQSNVVMNNMQQGSFYVGMNNVQQRSTISPNFDVKRGCFDGGVSVKDYCDMVEEKMMKKQQRMVRNREAAIRSRAKKKAYVDELEKKMKQLEKELERELKQFKEEKARDEQEREKEFKLLKEENARLKEEKARLKALLAQARKAKNTEPNVKKQSTTAQKTDDENR